MGRCRTADRSHLDGWTVLWLLCWGRPGFFCWCLGSGGCREGKGEQITRLEQLISSTALQPAIRPSSEPPLPRRTQAQVSPKCMLCAEGMHRSAWHCPERQFARYARISSTFPGNFTSADLQSHRNCSLRNPPILLSPVLLAHQRGPARCNRRVGVEYVGTSPGSINAV